MEMPWPQDRGSHNVTDMTESEEPQATDRRDPPFVAGERAMLDSWQDFHRGYATTGSKPITAG